MLLTSLLFCFASYAWHLISIKRRRTSRRIFTIIIIIKKKNNNITQYMRHRIYLVSTTRRINKAFRGIYIYFYIYIYTTGTNNKKEHALLYIYLPPPVQVILRLSSSEIVAVEQLGKLFDTKKAEQRRRLEQERHGTT